MKYLTPPFIGRRVHFLLLGGLVLLLSCQSDPIVFNPPGGYEYKTKSFPLNNETSETVQGEQHTGMSPRLYSGILSNGNTVSTLIRLLPQVLESHQVCDSEDIVNVKILLTSITPIAVKEDTIITDTLFQFNTLNTYLISSGEFGEDSVLTEEIVNNLKGLTIDATPLNIELNTSSLELNLLAHENTIIKKWCEDKENLGVIISYIPTNDESPKYLEFHSSDSNEGPRLFVEYTDTNTVSNTYNRYLFNNVYWAGDIFDEIDNGPHYIEVASSDNWDVINIFAFNLKENSPIPSLEMQSYDPLLFQDDIITTENLKTDISLLKINVDLNSDIEEMDSIIFSLNSAIAFRSNDDFSGDNQTNANPDSTENNLEYDLGELFNDYGIDNCPDEMETGNGECADFEEGSAFNSVGTEGNKQRDWTDYDGDGKWDLNEGEMWGDWGFDWCPDSLEDGSGGCLMEPSDIQLGYDPNGDNIDPTGDDWHEINNSDGTEGNQQWDPGEPFYDWGSDGLPESLMGYIDEMEGNDTFDVGEPFDDTGSDGLYNINELGYNTNRTEGNGNFDGKGEFNDCGEDNCCDSKDDEGLCDDVGDDNFNIDPNEDNWNDCGSDNICPSSNIYTAEDQDGTEGNNEWDENEGMEKNILLNWTDTNDENGSWDEGEGEEWFDWGLDQVPDSLESFEASVWILPVLHDNYMFDLNNEFLQEPPISTSDTVSLWISEIKKVDDNSLSIEVSVQSNKALKGLQFQLYHTPFTKVDTTLETYTPSIAQLGEDKLFEDFTLLPRSEYDPLMLDTTLQINYANDVAAFLDFDSLNLFLENEEYIFSHQYSNLVFYIDTATTDIHENGMWVYVTHEDDSGEDKILISKKVTSSSDSVEIAMGQILRAYQSGSISSYNGLKLKTDGNLYNYSKLSIKNNPRIDVMYSQ